MALIFTQVHLCIECAVMHGLGKIQSRPDEEGIETRLFFTHLLPLYQMTLFTMKT